MTSEPQSTNLVRSLTLTHAVLYGLGVTIGAGIYVLVGAAAGRSGMHAPLSFLAAALVMGMSAASFAELGTRMPVAASEAAYVQAAFRRQWLSLVAGLLVVGTAIVSGATISVGSAGYIGVFIPLPAEWIIAGVVVAMGAVACLSAVHSISFAGAMTLLEVGGLMLIIGAGLIDIGPLILRLPEMWPSGGEGAAAWGAVGQTALLAVFAFIGFEHLVNISEEMIEPRQTLPRALFITVGVTAVLYALVVWIAVVAVPPTELAASAAPLGLVFQRLTGLPLVTLSAIAVIATLNGIIVHMIMIGRVLYGLADQGSLPAFLAKVSPNGAPVLATLSGVLAMLVLALGFPLTGLAEWTSRFTLAIFALVNLALIRIKSIEERPPEKAFVVPMWVPVAGLATSAALLLFDVMG